MLFQQNDLETILTLGGLVFQFAYIVHTTKDLKARVNRIEGILLKKFDKIC